MIVNLGMYSQGRKAKKVEPSPTPPAPAPTPAPPPPPPTPAPPPSEDMTIVYIDSNKYGTLYLLSYFKRKLKRDPKPGEKIKFVVKKGVVLTSRYVALPAVAKTTGWRSDNVTILENYGTILGKGGRGGKGAAYPGWFENHDMTADNGGNGGPAIGSNTYPLTVYNYGVIASGGGGGGGAGSTAVKLGNRWVSYGTDSSGGGGAPNGDFSGNTTQFDTLFSDRNLNHYGRSIEAAYEYAVKERKKHPDKYYANRPHPSRLYFRGENEYIFYYLYNDYRKNDYFMASNDVIDDFYQSHVKKNMGASIYFNIPPLDVYVNTDSNFSFYNYILDIYREGNNPTYVPSMVFTHPKGGGYKEGGAGGFGITQFRHKAMADMVQGLIKAGLENEALEKLSGGKGGGWGEDGEDGNRTWAIVPLRYSRGYDVKIGRISDIPSSNRANRSAGNGGKAGKVATGKVTIYNRGSGYTKGRT